MRSPEQAEALDNAGMTYIDAHIKISRMSFQKLSSIGRQVLVECQTEKVTDDVANQKTKRYNIFIS